ncbi:MAG TPA: outer membrane protein transport protein [Acidobacteriota bacterium]|nr:outer membrane protein transport protein [Acidobacteriota bacterium]
MQILPIPRVILTLANKALPSVRAGRNLAGSWAEMIRIACLCFALLAFFGSLAMAQTNERTYEELDFRFVTPGARAVGMGKTFVGLADDATAAYSNPAGLSNLLEQEVSAELTGTAIKHHRFIPSNTGETQQFGDHVWSPSFFSYVLPAHNFTLSFFGNVLQHYKEHFEFRGRFIDSINAFENGAFGNTSLLAVNYGMGLSYLVNPHISIGGSLLATTVAVETHSRTGTPLHPRSGSDTDDSGTRPGAILGILLKPNQKISIGAVYNTSATYHMHTILFGLFIQPGPNVDLTGVVKPIDYVIPDRLSGGLSYRFGDHLTAAFDADWINYSKQITNNFLIFDFMYPESGVTPKNFFIRDVVEVHGGGEYRFYLKKTTLALRAGVFTDPSHPLRFKDQPGTDPIAAKVEEFRFNSLPDRTNVGFTLGAGIALSNRFQLDAAGSTSYEADSVVFSVVVKL